jgi:RNA polymerase sigma-70 factor (ECF subfamily)
MECLNLLKSVGSVRAGAIALDGAAELAAAVGEPEWAVEFYGARERILQRARVPEDPRASEEHNQSLDRLRTGLGLERFETAWKVSRATPYPYEIYLTKALKWLEGLNPRLLAQVAPVDGEGSSMPTPDHESSGSTAQLILRARDGDLAARELLSGRYLGDLRRFAHGRLPGKARDLMDSSDLVQVTLIRALEKLDSIRPKKSGGFFAYLRQILINQVRDQIRRSAGKAKVSGLSEIIPSGAPSPLEEMVGKETLDAYESALATLSARQREALILRIEHGFSYQEVADAIECPSANAARMIVSRALVLVTNCLRRS